VYTAFESLGIVLVQQYAHCALYYSFGAASSFVVVASLRTLLDAALTAVGI
jgi:hypothetical protein